MRATNAPSRVEMSKESYLEVPEEDSPRAKATGGLSTQPRSRARPSVQMSTAQSNTQRGVGPTPGSGTIRRSDLDSSLIRSRGGGPTRKSTSRLSTDHEKRQFKVEDFIFIRTLGQGSFGIVKLVCDRETNQLFALKCLSKTMIRGKKHIEHIKNERFILTKFAPTDFCCTIKGSM